MSDHLLEQLYKNTCKYSNYQALASRLRTLLQNHAVGVNSRWEEERLDYIKQHVDVTGKALGDNGANIGFFTTELIDHGAKKVCYLEGNHHHANFVAEAASQMDLSPQVHVQQDYSNFEPDSPDLDHLLDLLLLLSVRRHVGDDYGDQAMSAQRSLEHIAQSLRNVAECCNQLVFQLGFNWKGDRDSCLFEQGTKAELIDFVKSSITGTWNIDQIGVPVRLAEKIVYQELNSENIIRNDSLGEFLNRPLFNLSRDQRDE